MLRVVGAAEGMSQQAAGERLQIPPSRMVAFVDALEARGLLERRHNPRDRRTRALYLTEQGRELLGRAFALAAELERRLCAQLSDAEREQLLELLHVGGRAAGAVGAARTRCQRGARGPTRTRRRESANSSGSSTGGRAGRS